MRKTKTKEKGVERGLGVAEVDRTLQEMAAATADSGELIWRPGGVLGARVWGKILRRGWRFIWGKSPRKNRNKSGIFGNEIG